MHGLSHVLEQNGRTGAGTSTRTQGRTYRASGVAQADGSCYAHVPKTRRPRGTLSIHCRSLIHHVTPSALCWCRVLVSCSGSIFRGDLRKQHLSSLRGIQSSVYPHVRALAPRSTVSDFAVVIASPESPAVLWTFIHIIHTVWHPERNTGMYM